MKDKINRLKKMASTHRFRQTIHADKILQQLKDYIDDIHEDNNRLREIIEEFNQDAELSKKGDKIKELQNELYKKIGYLPNEDEEKEMKASMNAHMKSKHEGVGSYYSYIVTPTGLGSALDVRCNHCNEIIYKTDDIS